MADRLGGCSGLPPEEQVHVVYTILRNVLSSSQPLQGGWAGAAAWWQRSQGGLREQVCRRLCIQLDHAADPCKVYNTVSALPPLHLLEQPASPASRGHFRSAA